MENTQNQLSSFNNNSITKQSDNYSAKNQQKSSFAGKIVSIITVLIKLIFFPYILFFKVTKLLISYCISKKNNANFNNNNVPNLQNSYQDNKYQQKKLYSDFRNSSPDLKLNVGRNDTALNIEPHKSVKLTNKLENDYLDNKYQQKKLYSDFRNSSPDLKLNVGRNDTALNIEPHKSVKLTNKLENDYLDNKYKQKKLYSDFRNSSPDLKLNVGRNDTALNIEPHKSVKLTNKLENDYLDNKYKQKKLYSDFINASLALKPNLEFTDKVLGAGGYGEVTLAKLHDLSTKTCKYVAVKTYLKNPPENNTPKTHKDFVREVSIGLATKEDSDNFTSIIAAFEQSGTENFKIVMELGDLTLENAYDFFMENKKLPTDIIGYITCTFIHSLQQCIINNISRKDASVTNFLLFFNQNKIKSSDFGEDSLQENITFNAALGMTTKVFRIIEDTLDTYLTEDIDLDKKYDLNEKQEIVKTYFMPEINKTSLTQQQKDKIENFLIKQSCNLLLILKTMYATFTHKDSLDTTNLDNDTKMNLLMHLLDAQKKFIKNTIGYRETFIADVKKLYGV